FSFCLLHLLGLLASLVDGAHHVEGLLRQIVVLALEDFLESAHSLGPGHVLPLAAGESLRDAERLREKSLNLARTRYRLLVVFGEFLHTEDCNNVLEVLLALHNLLNTLRRVLFIMS